MKVRFPFAAIGLAALVATAAIAADVTTNYNQGGGGFFFNPADRSGPYSVDSAGVARLVSPLPSSNLQTAQVTVSVAPAAPATAPQIVAARPGRNRVTLLNAGVNPVYIGPAGVTATTGAVLTSGASLSFAYSGALYAVTASNSQVVSIVEEF